MASFTNQATLWFNGKATHSNIASGELTEALTLTKNAIPNRYHTGDILTYIITMSNSGTSALSGLTLTDTLGAYTIPGTTAQAVPLTYQEDSLMLYVNGVLQPAPTAAQREPLTLTDLSIPAGGHVLLLFQAAAAATADPTASGSIRNEVSLTGEALAAPLTAVHTVFADTAPQLSISKSICPAVVSANDPVTYTFIIQNTGNTAVTEQDDVVISDVLDPPLRDISVRFNDVLWKQQYTYTDNEFRTAAGALTVPAASYTQDPVEGTWTIQPGISTLTLTGTL